VSWSQGFGLNELVEMAWLAIAHLAERRANALLGYPGLPFLAAPLTLEPLHRCQKPQCFWLAI
jgi:hypothetical protein